MACAFEELEAKLKKSTRAPIQLSWDLTKRLLEEGRLCGVEIDQLQNKLEVERMRLTACGVVALSNTHETARENRTMNPEYWSASCGDVACAVDREMRYREALENIAALDYTKAATTGACALAVKIAKESLATKDTHPAS